MNAAEFQRNFCMSRNSFMKLWTAIKDHPVFTVKSNRGQTSSLYQLMVLLKYIGTEGDGMSNQKGRSIFPNSHGSFDVFKNRCVQAIIKTIGDAAYFWPLALERKEILH